MSEVTRPTQAAARWWAEQVVDPEHRIMPPGMVSLDMALGEAMIGLLASRHPVTREQADKFAEILTAKLDDRVAEITDLRDDGKLGWFTLLVDYSPDPILGDACEEADIHRSRLPIKSLVAFTDDYVVASLGAGAPRTLIWSRPGWERPMCGVHRLDVDQEPTNSMCGRPRYHEGDCGDYMEDRRRCRGCGLSFAGHATVRHPPGDYHTWEPDA